MHIRHLDSPIGVLTLVASDEGLTHVLFEGQEPVDVGLPDDLPETDDDPTLERAAASGATILVASHELERAGGLATRTVDVVAGQVHE